jgi:uncharacterized membrane protein YidH (DUF202 family)
MTPTRAAAMLCTWRRYPILNAIRPQRSHTHTKGEPMRFALVIIGIIMVAIGAVWILQGTGMLPGSVMSGQQMWAIIGAIVLVIGIVVLIVGARMIARHRPI